MLVSMNSKKKTTKKGKMKKKRTSNEKSKIIQITEILFDLIKFR